MLSGIHPLTRIITRLLLDYIDPMRLNGCPLAVNVMASLVLNRRQTVRLHVASEELLAFLTNTGLKDKNANFFNQTGDYPTYKRKSHGGSAEYTRSAFKWDGHNLTLAKMSEPLDIRWSRTLPRKAQPSTITVSLDPAGRWHVSILVEDTIARLRKKSAAVGIDLGTDSFAILSTGEKIDNPRHRNRDMKRLAKAQWALARKQKGSRNYEKARLKVARI